MTVTEDLDLSAFWRNVRKTNTCWLWTTDCFAKGYGRHYHLGRQYRAHRFIYEALNGPLLPGLVIDHRCHVTACVRPDHLRQVTGKQNQENRSGTRRDSGSGVRGVTWDARRNKWAVYCTHNYKRHWGGYYENLNEAAEAARQLRLSLFTHSDLDRKSQ